MGSSEYLEICVEQVRCRRMRPILAAELLSHIEDQKQDYMDEGISEEEAEYMAVEQMGDPVETGSAFDRVHRPKMDWKAMGMVLAAALIGVVLYGILYRKGIVGQYLFMNFLKGTLVGLPVMAGVCFLDYTLLGKHPAVVWWLGVAATLVITFLAPQINGRALTGWVIVLLTPLFAGVVYRYRGQRYLGILKVLLLFGLSWLGLTSFGALNTISMHLLFGASCMIMLLLAIANGWYGVSGKTAVFLSAGMMACAAAGVGYIYFFTSGFRRMRLQAWLNPEEYADGAGWLAVQMSIVRSQLNWTGEGAASSQWLGDVLQTEENYLFLGMMEGFGIIVSAMIILLLTWLICALAGKVLKMKNRLGCLVGTACCCTILIPLVLHLSVNLGLVPVTESWMPFFSGGGKNCVAFYAVLGILMSVFRNRECAPEAGGMFPCGIGSEKEVHGLWLDNVMQNREFRIPLPGGQIICRWSADKKSGKQVH